jgi:hypothetical protein
MILKTKYKNSNLKVQLEKDENDPYYNVITQTKKYNTWKIDKYYKKKYKKDAQLLYERL